MSAVEDFTQSFSTTGLVNSVSCTTGVVVKVSPSLNAEWMPFICSASCGVRLGSTQIHPRGTAYNLRERCAEGSGGLEADAYRDFANRLLSTA